MMSGYAHCACRDCFEIIVANNPARPELCDECNTAGCGDPGAQGWPECQRDDAYGADVATDPQCSCRDCRDVSATAAKGGWTLCRECLDAACTPYPPGTGPWPGRRPTGDYECQRPDSIRTCGCGGKGVHGVDHDD